MTGNNDLDFFLSNGHLEDFPEAAPMAAVLAKYGEGCWQVKEEDLNGLTYGIIRIGCIEIHIFDGLVNGVSYRLDLPFEKKDFKDAAPWIIEKKNLSEIEAELQSRKIDYKKYNVQGPQDMYQTAGAIMSLDEGGHTFIDTEGGATFIFYENKKGLQEACQVCRYYDLDTEER